MAEESESDATLKLTILSAEGLKDMRFLGKMKTFAVAWVDPQLKFNTKTLTSSSTKPIWNTQLSFPLSIQILKNPSSCITIQILSRSYPIHKERVVGTGSLSLSEIKYDDEVFVLQIWRPSGRAKGLLRVEARIEYNLGFSASVVGCVTGIPVGVNSRYVVVPSAPPLPLENDFDFDYSPPKSPEVDYDDDCSTTMTPVDDDDCSTTMPLADDNDCSPPMPAADDNDCSATMSSEDDYDNSLKSNVGRNLLIGVLGGVVAVATVLIRTSKNS